MKLLKTITEIVFLLGMGAIFIPLYVFFVVIAIFPIAALVLFVVVGLLG